MGYTPPHGAAFQGREEIMKFLIKIGMDVTEAHEGDGFAPFVRTCWGKEERHARTLRVLVEEAGVDPTVKARNDMTCLDMTENPSIRQVVEEYRAKHDGSEL